MKNFVLIDQLKFMQLKIHSKCEFLYFCFGKPIKNQGKQNSVTACLVMI